ncbi:uroporphyrinogen-III C-methyltransferase [Cryptobacterium curtum]
MTMTEQCFSSHGIDASTLAEQSLKTLKKRSDAAKAEGTAVSECLGATVYLVGAGPGDPGLLTVRAKELLECADVIIYDYLASSAVMHFANPAAQRIFVGKKGFSDHVTQEEINQCLIAVAQQYETAQQDAATHPGKGASHDKTAQQDEISQLDKAAQQNQAAQQSHVIIVRLKGGDPFVFGRGGEEALALVDADIPFEVVPGITAGVAAAAYAGIPVTHRTQASSVTLITGHETPDKEAPTIDWEHLAQGSDTLCFYMGIRDLPLISQRLIEHGRPADTPVALVRWGTTPKQEVLTATLDSVAQAAEEAGFQAPAIIVVGEVVALRDKLSWFDNRPLSGQSIVVTRSREQASILSSGLSTLGAQVVEFPTISIKPRSIDVHIRSALMRLASDAAHARESYDWVVFTSANGVQCFFAALNELHLDARSLGGVKVAAIGPATAADLHNQGISPDVVPEKFIAESVAQALVESGVGRGTRVLLPRAAVARDALPNRLTQAGAQVEVLPLYDTVIPHAEVAAQDLATSLRAGEVSAITFTSSSTVRNFKEMLAAVMPESELIHLLETVTCASIGPVTSDTMRDLTIPVSVQADTHTIPGLISALQTALDKEEQLK